MLMNENSRIYIAGHRGMVGSAIWRELQRQGFKNLIGKSRHEVDLLDASAVCKFFAAEKPEFFFDAAAKVGGIHANNSLPAEFLYENLEIQNHLIHAAWRRGVRKLLFLGSSCIYPKVDQGVLTPIHRRAPWECDRVYGAAAMKSNGSFAGSRLIVGCSRASKTESGFHRRSNCAVAAQ